MDDPRVIYLLISGLEASLGMALAWLFLRYWRQLERGYLRLWAGSFAGLGIYLICSSIAFLLARDDSQLLLRSGFTLLAQIGAYVHIGLLVLGTLSLLGQRDPPAFLVRGVLGSALVLGLIASLTFAWDPEAGSGRIFMRISLRYLIAATAYAGVAFALLGSGHGRGLGQRLTGIGFAFFATASLAGFLISTMPELGRMVGNSAVWLALFDLVAVASIGIGLFVWLHDEERGRAQSATQALELASFFDPGTRLPNRKLLSRRIGEQLRFVHSSGTCLALLVLRPDRCTRIREALGDTEFDVLLMRMAQSLDAQRAAGLPPAARLEDDRLAVLLELSAHPDKRLAEAESLLRSIAEQFGEQAGYATFSAGLAAHPQDAASAAALINAAVSAQARAELAGGGRLLPFSAELREREREELSLIGELHRALAGAELCLHLQPVVGLETGKPAYHEALVRWNHPTRGLLAPGSFLLLAEDAGLLPDLDRWALREGCRLLAASSHSDTCLAINLTAPTFLAADFGEQLATLLAEHGIDGSRLIIEITEAIAVDDPAVARANLERLGQLGVRVALDDVGTGFSSLDQLQRLPFAILKVDRVFVTDIGRGEREAAVARALITLGRSLGLVVVVEGIENERQLAFARSEGADHVQGYLLGGPIPADEWR